MSQTPIRERLPGNTRYASEPTQLTIDPSAPEGRSSGLHGPSVVKCCNLYTVRQQDILRVIGRLSDPLLGDTEQCLKAALGLG